MSTFNVLITGAKAGIGHGLLAAYAARPNTIVIAAIRDLPTSQKAQDMVASVTNVGNGSRIIPVQYDAGQPSSAQECVNALKSEHQISHLDTVIANAGVGTYWGPTKDVSAEDLISHFNVNTVGTIVLFQSMRDLLLASKGEPKFFYISSVLGSVASGPQIPFMTAPYGMSKAAGNYFCRKANLEEERIAVLPVHPGWVRTAMGDYAAAQLGMEQAEMTLETCIERLMKLFDDTHKDDGSGSFLHVIGDETMAW